MTIEINTDLPILNPDGDPIGTIPSIK